MGIDLNLPAQKRDLSLIRELQMVFQNPDSTLNPSYTIGTQIGRPIQKFKTVPRQKVRKEVERLLRAVKLDAYYYDRYPRQLSGGEKQRIGIARALASRPSLVICDEPVSALDVSVAAAVLNLLNEIKEDMGSTMIFIAHDLSVVRFISDFVAVMYLGEIVEFGPVAPFTRPRITPIPKRCCLRFPFPILRPSASPLSCPGMCLVPPTGRRAAVFIPGVPENRCCRKTEKSVNRKSPGFKGCLTATRSCAISRRTNLRNWPWSGGINA